MFTHKKSLNGLMVFISILFFLSVTMWLSQQTSVAKDQGSDWYWEWRQPPFEIINGYLGYPYIEPYGDHIVWGDTGFGTIYAATNAMDETTYPAGLYKSNDKGLSWTYSGRVDPDEISSVLVTHPVTPTIILMGFQRSYYRAGIYLSQDSGETWTSVLPYAWVYDIEFDPSDPNKIYASTLGTLGGAPVGIYRSEDIGQTWQQVSDLWLEDMVVHPMLTNTLFGVGWSEDQGGIYRSDDAGETWTQIANIGGHNKIIIDPDQPGRMFVSGRSYGGIWRTEDGGQNWVDLSSGLPSIVAEPTVLIAAIDSQDETLLVGLKYGGMLLSHDYGNSWVEINNGIPFFGGGIFGPQCASISIVKEEMAVACSGRYYIKKQIFQIFLPVINKTLD